MSGDPSKLSGIASIQIDGKEVQLEGDFTYTEIKMRRRSRFERILRSPRHFCEQYKVGAGRVSKLQRFGHAWRFTKLLIRP